MIIRFLENYTIRGVVPELITAGTMLWVTERGYQHFARKCKIERVVEPLPSPPITMVETAPPMEAVVGPEPEPETEQEPVSRKRVVRTKAPLSEPIEEPVASSPSASDVYKAFS